MTYDFAPIVVAKGYVGPVALSATWAANGNTRDLAGTTGTLTVYSKPPVRGVGGTVLLTRQIVGGVLLLQPGDTAIPGGYHAEISITDGAITDVWRGTWRVEGV